MKAKVRCICDRINILTIVSAGESAPHLCECGITLQVRPERGGERLWADMPEGYKLSSRQHNRPVVIEWVVK